MNLYLLETVFMMPMELRHVGSTSLAYHMGLALRAKKRFTIQGQLRLLMTRSSWQNSCKRYEMREILRVFDHESLWLKQEQRQQCLKNSKNISSYLKS